ncbi:MAG TPA: hypothetical protein DIU07_00590 [Rhodobacteraceae bacterium]|nr:hypothetical protein [Paracoccaceae bacterium]
MAVDQLFAFEALSPITVASSFARSRAEAVYWPSGKVASPWGGSASKASVSARVLAPLGLSGGWGHLGPPGAEAATLYTRAE